MSGEEKIVLIIVIIITLTVTGGLMFMNYNTTQVELEAIKTGLIQKCDTVNDHTNIIWVRPEEKLSAEKK